MNKIVSCMILGPLLLALSFPVEAQQVKKVPRIGYLSLAAKPSELDEAFKQGMSDLGWVEGQNIAIEYRWAANMADHLPSLAEELVRTKVDIIVASATPAVNAAKNATKTIPIVMGPTADPVGSGLVASLARPGGNITGVSLIMPELAGKRIELLREVLPKLSRVAFLAYGPGPAHRLFVKEAQDAAERFRMKFQPVVIGGPEEIEDAFSALIRERAGALMVHPIFVATLGQGGRIAELATKNRLPTISDGYRFAEAGGLIYYGPDQLAIVRRVAIYVDKILKGARPADLPVEQPMKFEFVINLKTAKQIGVTIPPNVLARADKVIR
jgi:putative tryptophan/tyrosine transport system substrate-binding protein